MGILKPVQDRVLIEAIPSPDTTPGGIIIPDTAKKKPVEGKVIAIGPGWTDRKGNPIPISVKVGDRILYPEFAGSDFTLEGKKYVMLRDKEILGILTYEE